MAQPSVKGSILGGAIDDLASLRGQGRVTDEQIEAALAPQDLAFLETGVAAALWYPMETYTRLMRLLGEVEGDGKDCYFVERGRANARRLMKEGLYQQLAFLSRWNEASSGGDDESALIADYASKLRMIVSLTSSIYNVGRWAVEPDPERPGRMRIAVREASAYSEPMRFAIEGFFNECARIGREGEVDLYRSERPSPDLILLGMTSDIAQVRRG